MKKDDDTLRTLQRGKHYTKVMAKLGRRHTNKQLTSLHLQGQGTSMGHDCTEHDDYDYISRQTNRLRRLHGESLLYTLVIKVAKATNSQHLYYLAEQQEYATADSEHKNLSLQQLFRSMKIDYNNRAWIRKTTI